MHIYSTRARRADGSPWCSICNRLVSCTTRSTLYYVFVRISPGLQNLYDARFCDFIMGGTCAKPFYIIYFPCQSLDSVIKKIIIGRIQLYHSAYMDVFSQSYGLYVAAANYSHANRLQFSKLCTKQNSPSIQAR